MAKSERQAEILEIVKVNRLGSQEALREVLAQRGFEVTQATLSRDIRDLHLVKITGADGQPYYMLPEEWETTPPLGRILPTLFMDTDGSGNLLVIHTRMGGAQAVALGIDWEGWPEVLGTISGVDTILVILRAPEDLERVKNRVEAIARA